MGHLINPISARLGFTSFWISNWSCFNVSNFSYNLMVDNLIKNFIMWAFSENKSSLNLTIIGVFLSHFKIVRRANNIRVFLFLILDSSRFLKSQSVELDSNVFTLFNLCTDKHQGHTSPALESSILDPIVVSSSGVADDGVDHLVSVKKKMIILSRIYNKLLFSTQQSLVKEYLMNYISCFLHQLFIKFFNLNKHFLGFNINIDPIFVKTVNFVNANFLSRFLSRRLSYGFELNRVLKPIVLNLKRLVDSRYSKIMGFRISCRGRFNKAQMASYTWEKYGPVPLNNFSCSIDYAFSKVIMKYGACGVKVWVFTSHSPLKNYRSSVLRQHVILNSNSFAPTPNGVAFRDLILTMKRNDSLRKLVLLLKLVFGASDFIHLIRTLISFSKVV